MKLHVVYQIIFRNTSIMLRGIDFSDIAAAAPVPQYYRLCPICTQTGVWKENDRESDLLYH